MAVKGSAAIEEAEKRAQALSATVREVEATFPREKDRTTLLRVVSSDGSAVVYTEVEPAATVTELALETGVPESALRTFAHTLADLAGPGLQISDDAVRRAALLSVASMVWEDELGPLLTSAQVSELLGGVSRQRVSELLGRHRLIGLRDRSGRLHFPAFQFSDGQPVPALVDAFWAIASQVSDWTAAGWCVSADPDALEGESPVQWAKAGRDAERLARVARQDAARLAA